MASTGQLVGWSLLVGALIVLGYASNAASSGSSDPDVLYRYSTAAAALVQYALLLGLVLLISRGLPRRTLGFVRPPSWPRALVLSAVSLGVVWGTAVLLNPWLEAGKEQGLVPERWQSGHAGAYVANFVVIALVAPLVEEMVYRGLGFAAVGSRFGPVPAIFVTGLAFGLSHGLVVALPVLTLFGVLLAVVRWRTRSLYPAIALHAVFNAAALIAAVTVGGA